MLKMMNVVVAVDVVVAVVTKKLNYQVIYMLSMSQ
jgi:hypothetical protein